MNTYRTYFIQGKTTGCDNQTKRTYHDSTIHHQTSDPVPLYPRIPEGVLHGARG
jgi:hypothetical protein